MPDVATETKPQAQDELVGFGDSRVEKSTFDRFKGRKGVTDRIAIISSGLPRAYAHFYNGGQQKTTFRCLSKKDQAPALCCQKLGEPTQKFGLVIFHYKTDDNGQLLDDAKCSGTVKLWLITEAKYEELSSLNKEWPLLDADAAHREGGMEVKQHDLLLKCTEEQYQRMTIQPTANAHWKKKDAWFKALKMKESSARLKVKAALGRTLTETEVMELFGMAPAAAPGSTSNAGDIDLGDVLE